MNEYLSELYEIETRKAALEAQGLTEEVKEELAELSLRVKEVRERYLAALGKPTLSKLKTQEAALRQMLFNLRCQINPLHDDSQVEAYQQTARQIRVIRRELAYIKFNIKERGKKR